MVPRRPGTTRRRPSTTPTSTFNLPHAWRFLRKSELELPKKVPSRKKRLDDNNVRWLIDRRIEVELEASLSYVTAMEPSSAGEPEAGSFDALQERTLQSFGAPSHASSWAVKTQFSLDSRKHMSEFLPTEFGPPPMLTWRPPERVSLATDVPPELCKGRIPVIPKKEEANVKKRKTKRLSIVAVRAAAGADKLRAQRAQTAPPVKKKQPGVAHYGKWYMPVNSWGVHARTEKDAAAFNKEEICDEVDEAWLEEAIALKRQEEQLQSELATAYIAHQFKQYIDDNDYRLPRALAACADTPSGDGGIRGGVGGIRHRDHERLTGHLWPLITALVKEKDFVDTLKKDFRERAKDHHVASGHVTIRDFREILAHRGFRFSDNEFHQLIAIVTNNQIPQETTPRKWLNAKVDYNHFLARCDDLLKAARKRRRQRRNAVRPRDEFGDD